MMRLAPQISIHHRPPADENVIPTSEVLLEGQPWARPVTGAVLEAAIAWRDFYLVFLTDDVPFEEGLNIHLFDRHGTLLSTATMGGAYTTGHFRDLQLGADDTLSFNFYGDGPWCLQLLDRPGFRLPLFSEPIGVNRPFGFSRHFIVSEVAQKTWR